MKLDAHQHFWKYRAPEYPWMKRGWPLRRDHLPPHLKPLLARAGIDGCIAVQARQSREENNFLLGLADAHPFIQGVVGWVDLRAKTVEQQLAEFARHPKFVGVRHVVQDEPDDDFMMRHDFLRGIGQLARFKLNYDILIYPRQLPAAIRLARKFPHQPFVLDHLAKPPIKAGTISPWREQITELARHPNVMAKISGLVTEADWTAWKKKDFRPYLDVALAAFGAERLMFGSDWPVCRLAGTYGRVFGLARGHLASLPAAARDKIFGGNAARFYLRRGG
ncbi:MAG: amidohydrolase family protein [Verrucomicrobia bacterium]|nr:amidohydrolase family protein [Verrucomicrobiota bacterium]